MNLYLVTLYNLKIIILDFQYCRQYILCSHKYFIFRIRRGICRATNNACAFKDIFTWYTRYWRCRWYLWSYILIGCFVLAVSTISLSVHTYYFCFYSKRYWWRRWWSLYCHKHFLFCIKQYWRWNFIAFVHFYRFSVMRHFGSVVIIPCTNIKIGYNLIL